MSVRRDFLIGLIDGISGYFLDRCPEDQNWEDFDPELDGVRTSLRDLLDGEELWLRANGSVKR